MNPASDDTGFYPGLNRYFKARLTEFDLIPADRGKALERISAYVAERVEKAQPARLTFICTHNSRRSQMAQIWAQTAAEFFAVPGVSAFSGGTEATAFDPRALSAMVRAGFRIDRGSPEDNPVYTVFAGNGLAPVRAFSKAFLDPFKPPERFLRGPDLCKRRPRLSRDHQRRRARPPSLRGSETARRNGSGAGPLRYDLPRDLPGDGLGVRPRGPGGRGGPGGRSVIPPCVPALRIPAPSRRAFTGNNG